MNLKVRPGNGAISASEVFEISPISHQRIKKEKDVVNIINPLPILLLLLLKPCLLLEPT
jgi:hypothetical protein